MDLKARKTGIANAKSKGPSPEPLAATRDNPDCANGPAGPRARARPHPHTTKDLSDPHLLIIYMPDFRNKPGSKSANLTLKHRVTDIETFAGLVQSLIHTNPLGCTSYRARRRAHPGVEAVREMYTAKFEYRNPRKKRIGTSTDTYDSVEGYEKGIAAVISNMANLAAHRGEVRHRKDADLFSVMLRCHDPNGELYFLHLARDRITLSSYSDEAILNRVEAWSESMPALG